MDYSQKLQHTVLASASQARGDIALAQAEAARIEQRSRDAFYHAAYAEKYGRCTHSIRSPRELNLPVVWTLGALASSTF